ncbi:TPA: phage major tail tube protein [Escherichia coli]|nr:phage major tail tube protein [Escherichia coli]
MALPRKLKHLNLFNDGNNWQGIVESLTLPKFTRKYEKYRGGGMPGAVDVDLGLDDSALDTEFSIGGTELLLFKQMGKATVDGIQLRFTGSIQRDDTGEVQAVELVVRGRHKEVDSGEWKTGESNTTKVTSTNSYLVCYLVGTDENVLVLNRTYANRSNAERAAKMQWERLQRGVASFSLQLAEGRADLYTEMPVKVSGFKQPIDDAEWTITTLTHTVSPDNGFTTSLELEVRIDDFEME